MIVFYDLNVDHVTSTLLFNYFPNCVLYIRLPHNYLLKKTIHVPLVKMIFDDSVSCVFRNYAACL